MGQDDLQAGMKICVCGYYYRPEFYRELKASGYEAKVIGKVPGDQADVVIPNVGLEWAAYDYYVNHFWDGEDVLFTHDDGYPDPGAFDLIAEVNAPCAFIFMDEDDAMDNGGRSMRKIGIHGRALRLSGDTIERLGGFWFDGDNTGYVQHPIPPGMLDYNMGVKRLYDRLRDLFIPISNAFIRDYNMFRRNEPVREVRRR